MYKKIERLERYDERGFRWRVIESETLWYPGVEDRIRVLVLKSDWGATTRVRYDQAGRPISGNLSLA